MLNNTALITSHTATHGRPMASSTSLNTTIRQYGIRNTAMACQ
jgi:hypothetical protein